LNVFAFAFDIWKAVNALSATAVTNAARAINLPMLLMIAPFGEHLKCHG
jgi:hypothetical protein